MKVGFLGLTLKSAAAAPILVGSMLSLALAEFDFQQGPRQFALGGAGVALPDRGHSANFNPALPALSFPKNRIALGLHPAWRDWSHGFFRFKDWNLPLLSEEEPHQGAFAQSLLGLPAVYIPKVGYIGLDKEALSTSFDPGYWDQQYSLTFSVAEDFLSGKAPEHDSDFEWTTGINLKGYDYRYHQYRFEEPSRDWSSAGFGFDLGWAARFSRIPVIPHLKATLGFAFLNLGPPQYFGDPEMDEPANSLPQEYRLGWSLEYRPFPPAVIRHRKWTLVRLLATQEFEKDFAMHDKNWNAYPFYTAFFKDLKKGPTRYYHETQVMAGTELTLGEILYLRAGRGRGTFIWQSPTWAFGYGIASGPLFKHFYCNYDYARVLSLGAGRNPDDGRGNYFPHEYGIQSGYLF